MSRVNLTQKVITIDSSKRMNGTTSSFDVKVDIPRFNAFNKASIVMCEVPKSYYSSSGVMLGQLDGAGSFSITGDKFWTGSLFASDLQAALGAGYLVSYSAVTGKLTINKTGGFTIRIDNALLAKYTGLLQGVVYTSDGSDNVVSVNIVDMQRYGSLFIQSDLIFNNNDNRLVTLFPGGTPDLGFMGYSSPAMELGSVNVSSNTSGIGHFSVVDDTGAEVDLNGVNMRLVISFYNETF